MPQTDSFSSFVSNNAQNIILLDSGKLIVNDQEFSIAEIDVLMTGVSLSFSKSEVVILSIESRAYHEWVITLMDGLQELGFQNLQIKTYND